MISDEGGGGASTASVCQHTQLLQDCCRDLRLDKIKAVWGKVKKISSNMHTMQTFLLRGCCSVTALRASKHPHDTPDVGKTKCAFKVGGTSQSDSESFSHPTEAAACRGVNPSEPALSMLMPSCAKSNSTILMLLRSVALLEWCSASASASQHATVYTGCQCMI